MYMYFNTENAGNLVLQCLANLLQAYVGRNDAISFIKVWCIHFFLCMGLSIQYVTLGGVVVVVVAWGEGRGWVGVGLGVTKRYMGVWGIWPIVT